MRKTKWPLLFIASIVLLLLMPACATTLQGQYVDASDTYTAALNGAIIYRQAGLMSDESYVVFDKARAVAADTLDRMRIAADAGNDAGFDTYYSLYMAAMRDILVWQRE